MDDMDTLDMDAAAQSGVSQYIGDSDLDEAEDSDSQPDHDGGSSDSEDDDMDSDHDDENASGSDDDDDDMPRRASSSRKTHSAANDEEDADDETPAELARQAMQKIPLKTLLKAQKRLSAKEGSSRKAGSTDTDKGEGPSTSKHRKGREAPRRVMAPALTKAKPSASLDGAERRPSKGKGKVKAHRDHKHAPTEVSSKRTVSRNRTVIDVPDIQRRDPRFDNLVGAYDPKTFQASYGFIDQAREDEIKRLKLALRATKKKAGAVDPVEREAMTRELTRLQSKQAAKEKEQREKTAMATWRGNEGKKQAEGKKTFYLKDKDRKKLVEEQRMQELQKDKRKLHKVLDRKKRTERKKDFRSAPPLRQS